MFNKKLKEKIKELEEEKQNLFDKLNNLSWKQEPLEVRVEVLQKRIEELEGQNAFECECVSERDKIIEAQATILFAFSEYIIGLDKKSKKVSSKVKKSKNNKKVKGK